MKPPAPLLTDPTLHERLKLHLQSVAHQRFPYDQERGLRALQDTLLKVDATSASHGASEIAPIGSASVGSSLVASTTFKLVLLTAIGMTAWGVSRQWRAEASATVQPVSAGETVVQAPTVATPAPDNTETSPSLTAGKVAPDSTPPEAVRPTVTKAPIARLAQATASSRARREIAQLDQLKRTLPKDPATALRLARHSAREFPQGLLREEREALIVLALWQLGEVAAARAGAEQFLANYPRSSFRSRVQEFVGP